MPNYKQADVAGTKWQRCNSVTISNEYAVQPMVHMCEEEIAEVAGAVFKTPLTGMSFAFNPAEVIALRNPETGELTGGTVTGADVYIILSSLYAKRAEERDKLVL
jgi:hypothetical protein